MIGLLRKGILGLGMKDPCWVDRTRSLGCTLSGAPNPLVGLEFIHTAMPGKYAQTQYIDSRNKSVLLSERPFHALMGESHLGNTPARHPGFGFDTHLA